jgi:hypothetical protein
MPARAERMTAFGKAIASLDDADGRKADPWNGIRIAARNALTCLAPDQDIA